MNTFILIVVVIVAATSLYQLRTSVRRVHKLIDRTRAIRRNTLYESVAIKLLVKSIKDNPDSTKWDEILYKEVDDDMSDMIYMPANRHTLDTESSPLANSIKFINKHTGIHELQIPEIKTEYYFNTIIDRSVLLNMLTYIDRWIRNNNKPIIRNYSDFHWDDACMIFNLAPDVYRLVSYRGDFKTIEIFHNPNDSITVVAKNPFAKDKDPIIENSLSNPHCLTLIKNILESLLSNSYEE